MGDTLRVELYSGFRASPNSCLRSTGQLEDSKAFARLPPGDVILFAPIERYLPERFEAKSEPIRLDPMPPNGVLEAAECAFSADGTQQVSANLGGGYLMREVLQ